jgi:HEAT repeat protein
MVRRTTARPGTPALSTVAYRATLYGLMLLAAALTGSLLLVVQEPSATRALQLVQHQPADLTTQDLVTLLAISGLPIASAIAAAIAVSAAMFVLRVSAYARRLHRYARRYLRHTAPLATAGINPRLVLFDSNGRPQPNGDLDLHALVRSHHRLAVLGEAGAGKTVALFAHISLATRLRSLPALWLGSAPVPILVPLDSLQGAAEWHAGDAHTVLKRQVLLFGSRTLASTLARLEQRQGLLVLCDGFDALPPDERALAGVELGALVEKTAKNRVVLTSQTLLDRRNLPTVDGVGTFERAALGGLQEQDVERFLRRTRATKGTHLPRANLAALLTHHCLDTSLSLPAALAVLSRVWASDGELPFGRATLYERALCVALADHRATGLSPERALRVLGGLASAMRRAGVHAVPVPPDQPLDRSVMLWLAEHEPLLPTEPAPEPMPLLNADDMASIWPLAIKRGVVVLSADGERLGFSTTVLEAAAAAWWLRTTDDGLGRLSPELLRREWVLPILLWAGTTSAPGDFSQRVFRLTDTPNTTAARTGLRHSASVQPLAAALALAATCEATLIQLARLDTAADAAAANRQQITVAEQHLRDLLDLLVAHAAAEGAPDDVASMLAQIEVEAGPEVAHSMGRLAKDARLSRLVRAQLVTTLGILASRHALATLMDLLRERDPVIRQALDTALQLAGPPALAALQTALNHDDADVRERAATALAHLGDAALEAALQSLAGGEPKQRASAAKTLGDLRAVQAESALIRRLTDDDSTVRIAAALALGLLGTQTAVAALTQHAGSAEPALRSAVARALGESRAPEALAPLQRLLADSDAQVRAAAAIALGLLGDERAISVLRDRRQDTDLLAQNAVHSALRRLTGA